MNTTVIALSGTSGAGKSTALRGAAALLGDAAVLFFDDYESVSVYPAMDAWLLRGADPNEFSAPQLAADLRALRSGTAITLPEGRGIVQPARYILLEEPFGRERAELAGLIDKVALIDIPADVALARKILRNIQGFLDTSGPQAATDHLQFFLPWYLASGRALYPATNNRVLRNCDCVLDGMLPPDQVAQALADLARL